MRSTFGRIRSQTFALTLPRYEDMFHSFYALKLLEGVGSAISRLKVDLLIHIENGYADQDFFKVRMISQAIIDGFLLGDLGSHEEVLHLLKQDGRSPYVVLNNYFPDRPVNCVGIDNLSGAEEAVGYLIKLGHERIAVITGNLEVQAARDRLAGYEAALKKQRLPVKQDYVQHGDFTRKTAAEATRRLLAMDKRPTAIAASSDLVALEVIHVIKGQKLRVPEDVSVVGFDDSALATEGPIPLTTVRQPIAEVGRQGTELLSQLIRGENKAPAKILLKTKLVVRESCRAPA